MHQPEDVVQDIVAAIGWHELEDLREVHGSLLFIDLWRALAWALSQGRHPHTSSAPVIMTMIPPCSPEGCASCVETWCLTLEKARLVSFSTMACVPWCGLFSNVIIEWSFCCPCLSTCLLPLVLEYAHVESGEASSVRVEGVIVELHKLLCGRVRSCSIF